MKKISHIPVEGLINLRDLGGLPTQDGQVTQYHRFLRSELPAHCSAEMRDFFQAVKLKRVIDLRRPHEIEAHPCALQGQGDWDYLNLSIMDSIDNAYLWSLIPEKERNYPLGHIYRLGLESAHPNFSTLYQSLAEIDEGAVLFHCAHGKDRTGIVAAMLLLNAGVADADIVANYSVSADYMWPLLKPLIEKAEPEHRAFLRSDAENMRIYLRAFHERFDSVAAFLDYLKLDTAIAKKLRQRLLDA